MDVEIRAVAVERASLDARGNASKPLLTVLRQRDAAVLNKPQARKLLAQLYPRTSSVGYVHTIWAG